MLDRGGSMAPISLVSRTGIRTGGGETLARHGTMRGTQAVLGLAVSRARRRACWTARSSGETQRFQSTIFCEVRATLYSHLAQGRECGVDTSGYCWRGDWAKGFTHCLKHGRVGCGAEALCKSYCRGRPDWGDSVKSPSRLEQRLVCGLDEDHRCV